MRDAVAYAAGSAALLLLGALGAGAGALGHVAWLAWTGSLVAVVGGCVAGAAVVAIEDMRGPTSGRGSAGHTDGAQADARRCALVLGPLRPTLRRWTIAVATLATRARCAARRVR